VYGVPVANAWANSIQDVEQQLIARQQQGQSIRFGPWPQSRPTPPRPSLPAQPIDYRRLPPSERVARWRADLARRGITNIRRYLFKKKLRRRLGLE
jgi:hypothetical protein